MFQSLKSAKGVFVSRTQADVETVRAQLGATEADIAALEIKLAPVALAAALSGDFTAAHEIEAELAGARGRVVVLQHALTAAEAAEAQRVADARSAEEVRIAAAQVKERQSRVRAFRQHISALRHATRDYQTAIEAEALAFSAMLTAGAACQAILVTAIPGDGTYIEPGDDPINDLHRALSLNRLYELCGVHRAHVGGRDPHRLPIALRHHSAHFYDCEDEPITKAIARIADGAGDALALALGVASPVAPPENSPVEEPVQPEVADAPVPTPTPPADAALDAIEAN